MHFFDQTKTRAQLRLEAHAHLMALIQTANVAILDALKTLAAVDPRHTATAFGVDAARLNKLLECSTDQAANRLYSGFPIFTLRLASADAEAAFRDGLSADHLFLLLCKSFGDAAPLRSLSGRASPELTINDTQFDVPKLCLEKFEKANKAVMEAVRFSVESHDPLLAEMYGTAMNYLKVIVGASRAMMTRISTTGVPMFQLRTEVINFITNDKLRSGDDVVRMTLTMFDL